MTTNNDALLPAASLNNSIALSLANNAFQAKIEEIDSHIITAAQIPLFRCTVDCPVFLPGEIIPEEAYETISIYQDRGFTTKYDGDVGTLAITWSNPRMTYQDIDSIRFPNPTKVAGLGSDFPASTLYLYQTNGVDLRAIASNLTTREVLRAVNSAALQGNNELIMRTFNDQIILDIRASVLTVLYADILTYLTGAGYVASFIDNVGLSISWANASSISVLMFSGEHATVDLTGIPSGVTPTTILFSFTDTNPRQVLSVTQAGFITYVRVIITTAFSDPTSTLIVGTLGAPNSAMPANFSDLHHAAEYENTPNISVSSSTPLYLNINPGTSTTGSGILLLEFTPS